MLDVFRSSNRHFAADFTTLHFLSGTFETELLQRKSWVSCIEDNSKDAHCKRHKPWMYFDAHNYCSDSLLMALWHIHDGFIIRSDGTFATSIHETNTGVIFTHSDEPVVRGKEHALAFSFAESKIWLRFVLHSDENTAAVSMCFAYIKCLMWNQSFQSESWYSPWKTPENDHFFMDLALCREHVETGTNANLLPQSWKNTVF